MFRQQISALFLLVLISFAGCDSSASNTQPPVNTATPTTPATTTPDLGAIVAAQCGYKFQHYQTQQLIRFGDLIVSPIHTASISSGNGFVLNDVELSDALSPSKPFQLNGSDVSDASKRVYSGMGGEFGYEFSICNLSSTSSSTIGIPSLKITALTPDSHSTFNLWESTCDSGYNYPNPYVAGGCGGQDLSPRNVFVAHWPTPITVGIIANFAQTRSESDPGPDGATNPTAMPKFPAELKPGKETTLYFYTPLPTINGTYQFAIDVPVNGTKQELPVLFPTFIANHPVIWSGNYCGNNSAMLSQMSAGNIYLCPQKLPA